MLHYDFSGYDGCYRDLTRLGLPIIIGQLGTIVMSFADTLMIGHHSTPELAAASFVNNMFVLVIIVALGYSYSITPTVGNLFGRGLHTRIGKVLLDGVASKIIVLDQQYQIINTITAVVKENGEKLDFWKAKGIFVDDDENIFIADTQHQRVIKCDNQGNFIRIYELPAAGSDASRYS